MSSRPLMRSTVVVIAAKVGVTDHSSECQSTAREIDYIRLARSWVEEEEKEGYSPPSASWPRIQPQYSLISRYRAAFASCGSVDKAVCHDAAFTLATALLGGSFFGHTEHVGEPEPSKADKAEGLSILRALASHGSSLGACGLAFCHLDGPGGMKRDERQAALLFEQAAAAGEPQAMCEIGTMYYLGDGKPADVRLAAEWFHRAAVAGVPAAMYLYAECLLEQSESGDEAATRAEAYEWLSAAGQLGHRGARARILAAVAGMPNEEDVAEHAQRYMKASGRKASEWVR